MDELKLTYFDFSGGRAEPARLALHIGGIPFEDARFAFGEFAEIRKTTPLNQVPTLHINGVQVTQSDAITRYVGRLAGLYPEDALQALFCDEILSALEDINVKLGATFGMTGDALKTAREALVVDALPRYLQWMQAQLEGHGGEYFADHRLTAADLEAANTALAQGPKDYKVKLFRVAVATHRTDWVVTNDLAQDSDNAVQEVCGMRWKIEQFHRELKQTTGIEKNQCRKARIQRNHIACAMLVWLRLTDLARQSQQTIYRIKHGLLDNYLCQQLKNPSIKMRVA